MGKTNKVSPVICPSLVPGEFSGCCTRLRLQKESANMKKIGAIIIKRPRRLELAGHSTGNKRACTEGELWRCAESFLNIQLSTDQYKQLRKIRKAWERTTQKDWRK